MLCGAVPVATDLGMVNSFLKPDVNYIEVPHTATAREYGEIINEGLTDKQNWEWIQNQNFNYVVDNFEMKKIAQEYIDVISSPYENQNRRLSNVCPKTVKQAINNLEFFNAPAKASEATEAYALVSGAGS